MALVCLNPKTAHLRHALSALRRLRRHDERHAQHHLCRLHLRSNRWAHLLRNLAHVQHATRCAPSWLQQSTAALCIVHLAECPLTTRHARLPPLLQPVPAVRLHELLAPPPQTCLGLGLGAYAPWRRRCPPTAGWPRQPDPCPPATPQCPSSAACSQHAGFQPKGMPKKMGCRPATGGRADLRSFRRRTHGNTDVLRSAGSGGIAAGGTLQQLVKQQPLPVQHSMSTIANTTELCKSVCLLASLHTAALFRYPLPSGAPVQAALEEPDREQR